METAQEGDPQWSWKLLWNLCANKNGWISLDSTQRSLHHAWQSSKKSMQLCSICFSVYPAPSTIFQIRMANLVYVSQSSWSSIKDGWHWFFKWKVQKGDEAHGAWKEKRRCETHSSLKKNVQFTTFNIPNIYEFSNPKKRIKYYYDQIVTNITNVIINIQ